MIIPQAHVRFNGVHWYCLQPGDGTRYQFGFIDPSAALNFTAGSVQPTKTNKNEYIEGHHPRIRVPGRTEYAHVGDVFSGIGVNGDDYLIVVVDMPGGQGCYPVLKFSLNNIDGHIVRYYVDHTGGKLYPPTVAAVLLAVSVLMHNPSDTVKAARRMLNWYSLLHPEGEK
jgi:hypothetical protein